MICSQCQSDNPSNAAFCDECGARLETACPNCGEPNRRSARFCRNCGQSINQSILTAPTPVTGAPGPDTYVPKHLAEKIRASRGALEGERKQVTVLFADIRNSTLLLEGVDPEVGQGLIDPVLQIMMEAVHRYEGTVNQVLGDGIMAIFGAPLAHEDHAVRACYAALAMQEDMRRYRDSLGSREDAKVQITIGMNSGEVVVRSIGNDLNMDYSALGHATHVAAKMQELADGGGILMTAKTLREVEGFIQVKSRGSVLVKGISTPIDAYEVVGATSARTRVHAAAARGLTPLVGRETEIALFQKLVEETTAARGQVFALVGEPGIGKSRLIHEFTRHRLPPDWLVIEGASVSYGKATPYFPLIELLRHYLKIADGEGSESIQDRVVMHVLELDKGLKDTIPPILSLLGALPDQLSSPAAGESGLLSQLQDVTQSAKRFLGLDPQQRRRNTLDALKRLLIRECKRQPVVAIFEDLHWLDNQTQAFLDSLIESLPMARMLLLVDYRPGYSHSWGDKTYYTQLRVDPLKPTNVEELLQHLLGRNKDLAPLKQLLIRRTEGNPFFAEESVRSLVETGFLFGEKGGYRPGLKIDDISIPSTVQNLVADRVDRLPIEEKHLLQTAAVIGEEISFSLLREIGEFDESALYQYMAHLQASEFLYESNIFPDLEYSFKHAITAEVAYNAMLHERKRSLHAKIVEALIAKGGKDFQDQIEKLAHHAYHGQLWGQAADFHRQAGIKAMNRAANSEAVGFFERSLDSLTKCPRDSANMAAAIDVRLAIRNPLFLLGRFETLYRYLREAEDCAEAFGDPNRLGRVLNFLISYYGLTGEHKRAVDTGQRNLSVNAKDPELSSVTYYYMGQAYHHMGQYNESVQMLDRALAFVDQVPYRFERFGTANIISVISRVWLVQCCAQLGKFEKGISQAQEAIQIAEEADHPYSLAYAHCSLGILHLLQGTLLRAIEVLEQSRKICEAAEIKVLRTHIGANLGCAYALAGRAADAMPLLEESDEQSVAIGRKAAQSLRLTWHAQASLLAGQLEAARAQAARAWELAHETGEKGYASWASKLLGDIALDDRLDPTEPRRHYEQALTLAESLAMRPLQAHCHLGLGSFYINANEPERARHEISTAVNLYKEMYMTFWFRQAEMKLATLKG